MNPPAKLYCATCSKCGFEETGNERRVRVAAEHHVGSGPDDHRGYTTITTYVRAALCATNATKTSINLSDGTRVVLRRSGYRSWLEHIVQVVPTGRSNKRKP